MRRLPEYYITRVTGIVVIKPSTTPVLFTVPEMKMYLAACVVALTLVGCVTAFDAFVETTGGFKVLNSPQITWFSPLVGKGPCRMAGVLKLSFGAPGSPNRKDKVLIDMWFTTPRGWVFNIGDSKTNNGYGGDSGSTSRDAEIQGTSSTFRIYGNDHGTPKAELLLTRPGIIQNRLSIIIADGIVIWNNWGAEFNYMLNGMRLFALNGQEDKEAKEPNYDIYFGINRSIGSAGRRGRGLCWATVKWL